MTGIVGFSAELALFLCVVGYGMRRLGLLGTRNGWMKLVAVTVTTGVAGGSLPYLIEGSFRFSAATFACAVALSQIAFAMTRAWARPFVVPGLPSRDRFLLIGCLAAVLTHFVEIQFSFPVAETRLYFWVMCALSVVVAQLSANGTERVPAASADPLGGNVIGVLSGILLVALTFVVYTPDTDLRRYGPAVAILLFAVWLFAAVAVVSRRSGTPGGAKSLTSYAVASLGTWLAFVVAYHPWVAWTPPTDVPRTDAFWAIGVHCADTIVFPYVAFLLAILATAVLLAREEQSLPCPSWHSARSVTLSLAVTATALFIIVETNVIPARADAFSKQGIAFESLDQWEGARMVYEEAARLMRRFDHYAFRLGRVLMKSAYDVAQEGGDWRKELEQAQAQFDRARKIGPFDLDHLRNQARLHRLWALLADDAQEKRSHYGRAESLYVQATQLAPNHVIVWNDLALLYREMGRRSKALEALDQSLRIDARHPNAYSIRGDLLAAEDKLEPALRDYERALRYDSRKLEALSGRAFVLARLGRVEDAIEANLMVLQHAPGSFTTYRNLAILYRQKGSHDQALAAAQEALQRAPEGARAEISDLVAHLQSEREQRSSR
jgi:tetratricopeptide (TPR) repeat protein